MFWHASHLGSLFLLLPMTHATINLQYRVGQQCQQCPTHGPRPIFVLKKNSIFFIHLKILFSFYIYVLKIKMVIKKYKKILYNISKQYTIYCEICGWILLGNDSKFADLIFVAPIIIKSAFRWLSHDILFDFVGFMREAFCPHTKFFL